MDSKRGSIIILWLPSFLVSSASSGPLVGIVGPVIAPSEGSTVTEGEGVDVDVDVDLDIDEGVVDGEGVVVDKDTVLEGDGMNEDDVDGEGGGVVVSTALHIHC